jgi:hypothetical protein
VALLTAARRLIPAAAVAAVWLGHHAMTHACSCIQPPAPRAAAAEATAVFEGRTFGMHHEAGPHGNRLRFSFEVSRVFKGDIGAKIDVTTPASPAMCGRAFEIGVQYIVYARAIEGGGLADSLCSRTRSSKNATEDLAELGPGVAPSSGSSVTPPTAAAVEPPRIEAGPPPSPPTKRGCSTGDIDVVPMWLLLAVLGFSVRRATPESRSR